MITNMFDKFKVTILARVAAVKIYNNSNKEQDRAANISEMNMSMSILTCNPTNKYCN